MTAMIEQARRGVQIGRAFLRMGYLAAISYPMSLSLNFFATIFPLLIAYFLGRIIQSSTTSVGGDYFLFFSLGLVSFLVVNRGIQGLSLELDQAIQQGRLEMLLIEPIRWRDIPLGLALWPNLLNLVTAGTTVGLSLALGATFRTDGIASALLIVLLGVLAGLGVGVLAAGIRVLSKREDPLALGYNLATAVLAGQWFPISVLPSWLRGFSWFLPTTYVNSGLRKALMPHGSHLYGPTPGQAIVGLLLINVALYPLGLWLFGRSLNYGRKMGLLAGY